MTPRYSADGTLWFTMVLPTANLRALVRRKLLEQYPQLNYSCQWRDKHGAGLMLTVAAWVPKNRVYEVPA